MSFLRIAHLSDPHFGTILPGVRDGLHATLQDLQPHLILLTGDITQRARARQFREAQSFAESLKPIPLICVPGNHDIPLFNLFGRFFAPYRGFQKYFKYLLEKDYIQGDVIVTGLNSTSRWRHIQGSFNVDRIKMRLGHKNNLAKVHIAAFHHPMDCAKPQDEKNLLKNGTDVMNLFEQNRIDLIVGGHIHDPYVTLSNIRYPQINRRMVISVAGTCLSSRTRKGAPNSFNLIEVDTHNTPKLTLLRYDQRSNLQFTLEQSYHFTRPTDSGWIME